MSKRSYTSCYIHLIWGTKNRSPLLGSGEVQSKINHYFQKYFEKLKIKVLALYTNPEHVHFLIELPVDRTIQDIVKLLKGSSSHWINHNDIIRHKFSWGIGYAVFTVSGKNVEKVKKYIQRQKEHHQKVTFNDEYMRFLQTDKSV